MKKIKQDVPQGLIDYVQHLLLELGKGFSFVGRQYHMTLEGEDYYLDLLFYHYRLRCFVVVELKTGNFDPRDAGQLNFYLSLVDSQLKSPHDNQTLGMIICKGKNNIIAEYALRDIHKPIGVAGYEQEIVSKLPKKFKSSLPTIEEIENEFEKHKLTRPIKKTPKKRSKKSQ